jgi:hypothetical protein
MKKLHLLFILVLGAILTLNAQPKGALKGLFSVSASKKVCFAQGNLQYQASTNTWRFAENQYDALTTKNTNVSATYDGWIDLFGWGTSGYDEKYPYMISTTPSDYGNGSDEIERTLYDWGLNNAIINAGNKAGLWRTPTYIEWYYILVRRENAEALHGLACVNGINGLIILPDNCVIPEDFTFNPGGASEDKYGEEHFKTINEYSLDEWEVLENLGALFLPATGFRFVYSDGGIDIFSAKTHGYYWSSTSSKDEEAFMLNFGASTIDATLTHSRIAGFAVRLITDNTSTSTNSINIESTPIEIYTTNNVLHIKNFGADYQVFNMCGSLIYSGNEMSITLSRGLYIVKINNSIHKIAL